MTDIDETLWGRAADVAALPYRVVFEWDVLADGSPRCYAFNCELPGCCADGVNEAHAQRELLEARTLYIYSLFEDGHSVQGPQMKHAGHTVSVRWYHPRDLPDTEVTV